MIDFITISTTANAVDFGDVSAAMYSSGAVSSKTRAVMMGGYVAPAMINTMEYVVSILRQVGYHTVSISPFPNRNTACQI